LITSLIVLVTLAGAPGATDFDAFFEEFSAKRDEIQTLEARFQQKNVTPEETRATGGSIIYANPRRIVFRYLEPERGATYVVDEYRAYEYIPEIEQVEIHNIRDNPQAEIFFLGFEDNAEQLQQAYNLELFDPAGTAESVPEAARGLAIRPKPKNDEPLPFKEVRLYLREKDYLPVRIHVINDEESQTFIDISAFTINQPLPPEKAQIQLPEGVKVIEDGRLVETVGAGGKNLPGPVGAKPE